MALKQFKPYTKSTRSTILIDRSGLWKGKPYKPLTSVNKSVKGRNNMGRITARNHGGGHKQKYRIIDFYRKKFDVSGLVERIEYDPNRSCHIMLIKFEDGDRSYYLAPQKIKVGDKVQNGPNSEIKVGNALPLSKIPLGTVISCIELNPGAGAIIARSAGAFAQLMARDGNIATIKLPSGETRTVATKCMACIGAVSNSDHQLLVSGKAGRSRWLGRRPRTRPVAMNPVDHPMGGGEGRASGGHPRSKNGIPAKGFRTRSKTKSSNKFIIERRNK